MTDRFRYLPCDLHDALYLAKGCPGFGYDRYYGATGRRCINLAHPAGWDHAVRGYAAIRGVEVPESSSVAFLTGDFDSCVVDGWTDGLLVGLRADRAAQRREALCRCICAALNLNPEDVFLDV